MLVSGAPAVTDTVDNRCTLVDSSEIEKRLCTAVSLLALHRTAPHENSSGSRNNCFCISQVIQSIRHQSVCLSVDLPVVLQPIRVCSIKSF